MKSLVSLQKDESGVIASINGDNRFVSRITSIGLTPGCKVTIVKNEKKRLKKKCHLLNLWLNFGEYRFLCFPD